MPKEVKRYLNYSTKYSAQKVVDLLLYSLPSLLASLFFWIAFYPGIMTNDFFNQWMQVHTGRLYDWHPVPHTLFIYVVTRLWDSPAVISLTQAIIASLVTGYVFYSFAKLCINKKLLMVLSIIYGLNPVNAVMNVSIWKDVLYNCSLALLTVFIVNILSSKGEWITYKRNIISFIFTCLVLILFRHNGIVPFVGTILTAFFLLKDKRKTLSFIFIIVALIFVVIKGPVYKYLKVIPGTSNEAFAIPTQQIAAVVKHKGNLTEEQKEKINNIMPLSTMAENYHPFSVDLLKFNKQFNREEIVKDKPGFLKLWFKVCSQNPEIVAQAFLKQSSLVWQIKQPAGRGYTYTVNRKLVKNNYNIENKVINQGFSFLGNKLLDFTERKKNKWLFWRPALPLYIMLIFGLAAALIYGRKNLLLILPVLLNNLTILITIPAQDYRYLHANNAAALIAGLFFFYNIQTSKYHHWQP